MWLGTFLNVSMLFVLVRSTGAAACISSGVLLGLSALARANVLVMVFVVVPWILMSGSRRRWRHAGYFLAALIVTILPATVHNFVASRDFVPITSNGGVNFYIGNSEDATGIFYPPRGINLVTDDAVHTYVERVLGRKVSPSEASDYWFDEAATYIRSHPADWVVLMGRKTAMFFNGYEIPQIESFAIARERYAILRVMFVNAWMLIALGVTGMLFAVGRWRKFFLLYGYVFAFALSIILFFITSRYRVQIAPALALFAAWAVVVALPDAITSLKRRIWPLALIALLVLATNPSIFALPEDEVRWREHTHESRRLSKIGKYDEAVAEANAAIEVHPDYADSYINRALIEKDAGKRFEAVEDYARAVEINPNLSTVQYDFGQLLRSLKMNGPAIEAYRRAVELNPLMLEAYNNLGITYQLEGRYEEAITQFERVIALDPQYIKAYNNLGASLAQSGQLDRAIDVLTRGIEMDPDYSGTYRNLAMIYVQKKDVPRAYEEMTRYVELEPEDRQAVEVLAQLRMVVEGDTLGVTPAPGSEESQQ
jgi:tetratricopeptide (TPR) repeat protein